MSEPDPAGPVPLRSTEWDGVPCGYLRTADDGRILAVNDTLLELLGRSSEDVVGRLRFVDLLSGGGRIYHETHFVPMLRMHGEVRALALDLRHLDGSRVPVLINARRDGDGAASRVQIVTFEARERREYEDELLSAKRRAEASEARATALSRTLQSTLIPPMPPVVEGLEIAAAYRPAGDGSEVGGDFYDVFQVAHDEWVVTIGDVEGKGVLAAAVTALARHVLRAASVHSGSPREALLTLNEVLLGADTTRLLTAVVVRLRRQPTGWAAVVASAGHAAPIISSRDGETREFGANGTILGVLADPRIAETATVLAPGDVVLLTTDGVAEAWSPAARSFYGADRTAALVERIDRGAGISDRLVDSLLSDVLDFSSGMTRDDLAIVAFAVD